MAKYNNLQTEEFPCGDRQEFEVNSENSDSNCFGKINSSVKEKKFEVCVMCMYNECI